MKGAKHLTIVIKLGSSSIIDEKTHHPKVTVIAEIVNTAVQLRNAGHRVVIVSSGAIAVGLRQMNIDRRPKHLPEIQALAAIGQCHLMKIWDTQFEYVRQPIAQILITRNDISDRTRYRNAQNTLGELLRMGVIPIVNENDTIAVSEIKFGDNDTLSAVTAAMVQADYLFLMTDVDCLYTTNPRIDPDAKPIEVVTDLSMLEADVSSAGSSLGTGGMSTKIVAAQLATSAGVTTIITRSSRPGNVNAIVSYIQDQQTREADPEGQVDRTTPAPLHTRFLPSSSPIQSRHFWILHALAAQGTLYIDEGAYAALLDRAGLFPAGVVDVEGEFAQFQAVRLVVVRRLPKSSVAHDQGKSQTQVPSAVPAAGTSSSLTSYEGGETLELSSSSSSSLSSSSASAHNNSNNTSSSATAHTPDHVPYDRSNPPPIEVGKAIVNYSSAQLKLVRGMRSSDISKVLGYADSEYVASRESISLLQKAGRNTSGANTPTTSMSSSS